LRIVQRRNMLAAQYHLLDYPEKGVGLHYTGFSTPPGSRPVQNPEVTK